MGEIVRDFLARLDIEEKRIDQDVGLDHVGVLLLTAIKEFDFYYYNYVRNEQSDETDQHMYLIQLGLPKLISRILSAVPAFKYPVVTFQSDRVLILAALDIMAGFGFVEQGRRLAHAALSGECEIKRSDEKTFDIVVPDFMFNMEHHEAQVEHHYNNLFMHNSNRIFERIFDQLENNINKTLHENVYLFKDKFIGYDAHPDLDDFFFGLASSKIMGQRGWDSFNYRLTFGGVSMQKYMLATTYFLSLALKHERFAESLIAKEPKVRLRDVLTITSPRYTFNDHLVRALDKFGSSYDGYKKTTHEEAKIIIDVLSVRRDNLNVLSSTMAPLPFLIEFSDAAWITSVAAAQTGAVAFLLNSLKTRFPEDYNRNQQTREGSMQKALRRLLDEDLPGLSLIDNVKIRRSGRVVTDIDFAAIDQATGTIVLFQLKTQDHYGADMRRRFNRGSRLRKEAAHWLAATRNWLSEEPDAYRRSLRLKASFQPSRVHLVILAKDFAHFLSTLDLREDASYATWTQFCDALIRMKSEAGPKTLDVLASILQRFMSHKMASGSQQDLIDNYHLPGLSYRIRPASAEGVAVERPRRRSDAPSVS